MKKFVIGDKKIIIDKEDITLFNSYKWYLKDWKYLVNKKKNLTIYFHRLILGFPTWIVDHINRNTLDNRKINLRIVDKSQNSMNSKTRIDNSSWFKWVSFRKDKLKWHAYININKKRINIWYYKNIKDAIKNRILFENKIFWQYSSL